MADLLTIAEAAERLRVSARTVEREIAAGRRSRRLRRSGASEHPDHQVRDAPGPEVEQPFNEH